MKPRFTRCRYPAKRALAREPVGSVRLWKKTVPIKAPSMPATTGTRVGNQYRLPGAVLTGIGLPVRECSYGIGNTYRKDSLVEIL
jgi:hypothetical protein